LLLKKPFLIGLMIGATALATACGGGGGGGSSTPGISTGSLLPAATPTPGAGGTTTTPTQSVRLQVTIPGKTNTAANARTPKYISPNSGSMTLNLLSVNGNSATVAAQGPFNLTAGPSNPNCAVANGATTCTFSLNAPVGTDIFLATTYTTANGTGNPLGSGAILLTVKQNSTNTQSLVLNGPVASVQLVSSVTSISNANPSNNVNDSAIARSQSPDAKARAMRARHNPATTTAKSLSTTRAGATASRRTATAAIVSPTPPPAGPLTSRIFVIALDAVGNQIINPTTFDIPIQVQLSLNGMPANSVSLNVAYAGLSTQDTGSASTSSDGGFIIVYAPSDQITLAVGTVTSPQTSPFSPSLVATYTPQGGTLQTTAALTYSVSIPPPAPFLMLSATHVDPLTTSISAPETISVTNSGTAATSGQVEVDLTDYYGLNLVSQANPAWTCTPYYGEYIDCVTNSVIPAGSSMPLVVNLSVSSGSTPQDLYLDGYGGGFANAPFYYQDVEIDDVLTVVAQIANLAITRVTNGLTDGNFEVNTAGSFSLTVQNTGTLATSSLITLTDTLPSGMSGTGSGAGWACSSAGIPVVVTCTNGTVLAPSASAAVVTVSGTPATIGSFTNNTVVSSSGANGSNYNDPISVYGPLTLTAAAPSVPDHLQLFLGTNGVIVTSEPSFTGSMTATILAGSVGGNLCSTIVSIPTPTKSGGSPTFSITPLQVTGVGYIPGNASTYCTVQVTDVNGFSATIPVTVTSTSFTGQ
jgi:hypothetical protein